MVDTINIPGFGPTKKTAVYVVGGGAAALLGYTIYRQRQAAKAAAASAATTPTDNSQLDPATGYPYGSPEDASALAAQASYISPGGAGYTGIPNSNTPISSPQITDNGAWTQAAESALTAGGLDFGTVSEALGKYITGQAATPAEKSIINQAIAAENYPPQSGPNGFPPSIRDAQPAAAAPALHDVVELARLSGPTNARQLEQQHSDPSANANTIEAELRLTYADPRNAPYRAYYQKTGGWWPAKAAIWVHAAKKV